METVLHQDLLWPKISYLHCQFYALAVIENPQKSKNQFISSMLLIFSLTEYSSNISKCLYSWAKMLQDCNGNTDCLEECGKELRACLDIAFPPSTKLEFESDKINYMLSTVFFLSNRLTKAISGLSEIDKAIGDSVKEGNQSPDNSNPENKRNYEKMEREINDILAKYF